MNGNTEEGGNRKAMFHALSIDMEDWFCVYNLSWAIPPEKWDSCELRVEASTRKLLAVLQRFPHVKATFFVLGWIAEKVPGLVAELWAQGHEIATHGYRHQLLTQLTPEAFEADLRRSLVALERCDVPRGEIIGYRAPSFTITGRTRWAYAILEKCGLRYDSSIFPIGFHPDYGIADAPLAPYRVTDHFWEFPLSCAEVFGRRLPCSGGGYFRLFPYLYTKLLIRRCQAASRPVVFYLHPWELDPGQPRIRLPLLKRFRHYFNLSKTESRLQKLLQDFQFTSIREVLHL